MNKDQLTAFLTSIKRSKPGIMRAQNALSAFETWLTDTQDMTIKDDIKVEHLSSFIDSVNKRKKTCC